MMMVPRAYGHTRAGRKQDDGYSDTDEKRGSSGSRDTSRDRSRDRSLSARRSSFSSNISRNSSDLSLKKSTPVQIPSRSAQRPKPNTIQPAKESSLVTESAPTFRRESAKDILSSTTIPTRRKAKPKAIQRLPNCDYVADFSKLLLDDVKPSSDANLSNSVNNPQFDGLFGNIDELVEGQMFVGSAGLDAGILTTRSLSTDSLGSFVSREDMSPTELTSLPSFARSPIDRRLRKPVLSESCPDGHPLLAEDEDDFLYAGASSPEIATSPSPTPRGRASPSPASQTKYSTFKSSLTASLKALRSAAQSVSNIAAHNPTSSQEDLMTRSFFDIQPSLTDDRRPPPSTEPPSPALRRYLNPRNAVAPDSPAQLHFWLDHRPAPSSAQSTNPDGKTKLKIKKKYLHGPHSNRPGANLPHVVPLATCIPPAIRTAHASSPPIWLAPDGTPSNKHTAQPSNFGLDLQSGVPRHREPRENRDFLRIFVCEMNMRKNGKLSEDAEGRACLWLPPVQENKTYGNENESETGKDSNKKGQTGSKMGGDMKSPSSTPSLAISPIKKPAAERWKAWTADDS